MFGLNALLNSSHFDFVTKAPLIFLSRSGMTHCGQFAGGGSGIVKIRNQPASNSFDFIAHLTR
jgi:hypothetical protein